MNAHEQVRRWMSDPLEVKSLVEAAHKWADDLGADVHIASIDGEMDLFTGQALTDEMVVLETISPVRYK